MREELTVARRDEAVTDVRGPEVASDPPGADHHHHPVTVAGGLLRAARPKQWAKNVLVLAAPGAAGVLGEGDVLARSILAFAAFCLVASGNYIVNDVADREADRRHPTKQHRPIASGAVPERIALAAGLTV